MIGGGIHPEHGSEYGRSGKNNLKNDGWKDGGRRILTRAAREGQTLSVRLVPDEGLCGSVKRGGCCPGTAAATNAGILEDLRGLGS